MANWGLPLAALADLKKDASIISPKMTFGKFFYSVLRFVPKYSIQIFCAFSDVSLLYAIYE